VDVAQGAKTGALILLNCRGHESLIGVKGSFRVAGVDAVKIALEYGLGSRMAPIINTVILGAYARVSGDLSLPNLLEAIGKGIPVSSKQNMAAAEAAYYAVFKISGDVDAA
jgi:Pyruvate/2-oxoacid:ferredoxin oxidoreductase gamma subunit